MNTKNPKGKNKKDPKDPLDRLLAIPGIKEAIKMVRQYSLKGAIEDAWVRKYIKRLPDKAARNFTIDDSEIDYGTADELLEDLAHEAATKIVELWVLSEPAEARLAEIIYWGENQDRKAGSQQRRQNYYYPFVIVANVEDPDKINSLSKDWEFAQRGTST